MSEERGAAGTASPSTPAAATAARQGRGTVAFRVANTVVGALFLLGAAVQWNDPDPLRWMLIYTAAAAAALLAATGRIRRGMAAAVAVVALLWAGSLAPGVLGRVRMGELVEEWEMKDTRVEEAREMYGLLLIAAWMGVLTAAGLRRRAAL
jgi:hypothetical protein